MTGAWKPTFAVIAMSVIVGGCATKLWHKSGAGQAEFQIDKGACLSYAYSSIPTAPAELTLGGGYTTPTYMTCSGHGYTASCVSSGGQYVPPVRIPYDANRRVRDQVFASCMYSKGWSVLTRGQIEQIQGRAAAMGPTTVEPTAGGADSSFNQIHWDASRQQCRAEAARLIAVGTEDSFPNAFSKCMHEHGF